MAKSSIVASTFAAALIAGSVGLAHAQAGGGGGTGGTGGSAGSPGGTGAAGANTSPSATQTNPGPSDTKGTNGSTSTNPGTGTAGVTGSGGNHRQPKAGDLPRKDRQALKRDRTEKNIDRLIGSICRGC